LLQYDKGVKEFLFEDDRPFNSCHSASLLVLPNGEILVTYFGGTREREPDVAVWTSRRTADGWQPPVKVADEPDVPLWNPVLFQREDGLIFLFYKVGPSPSQWKTMVIRSDDNGHTWTEPEELVPGDIGGRGPVKNKPIVLSDGTIAAPGSLEPQWDCFVDLSTDGGLTWDRRMVPLDHSKLKFNGIIQPTLWESEPGHVHMLTRSTEGCIFRSDSTDYGRTWCEAYPTEFPNGNSGFDLVKLKNGTLVMALNPTRPEPGKKKGARTPLVVWQSDDNGLTWRKEFLLDDGEKQYSYPAVVVDDEAVHIAYTWRRERIAYWKIPLSKRVEADIIIMKLDILANDVVYHVASVPVRLQEASLS